MEPCDSLWMRCFWTVYDRCAREGATTLDFRDVDTLVAQKSQLPAGELAAFLS